MIDKRKLDLWADKLLDTGKRNNLISFRDSKSSSAEILFPDCDDIFSKCAIGHQFEVYKTPSSEDDIPTEIDSETDENNINDRTNQKLTKQAFKEKYAGSITSDRYVLVYAQTPNPLTAIKNIAKKAKELLDETGINVAYLAFGFIKWTEKEGSDVYYRAPLLLVHINIITGSIIDPVKIEISDDDIVVNPTFNYLLQADYGLSLPPFEDGDTLLSYFEKVSYIVEKLGWEIIKECKIGTFSFLKINMYEDLKKNAVQILENQSIKTLLGEEKPCSMGFSDVEHVVNNPLIDLHTVVDADSSQIEAIEMAKSGRSFVLQGPPGTGKSQTITNIIAERLFDGKKVLFVSEKQAALNVVFDKLKKAGLSDFCLELHSHKANKKAVIEELNRTLEVPKSMVASSIQTEISEKRDAQKKLDGYAAALHKKREVIDKSLYQLFEAYSAERMYPEIQFVIPSIRQKGQTYLQDADSLLKQYVEYTSSIGTDYKENAWYGFNSSQISYDERNQLRDDLGHLLQGFRNLLSITNQIKTKYAISQLNYSDALRWRSFLTFYGSSDVITPMLLSQDAYNKIYPQLSSLTDASNTINQIRSEITKEYRKDIITNYDGQDLYNKLTDKFGGRLSRVFNSQYKNLVASILAYANNGAKPTYHQLVSLAEHLIQLQKNETSFSEKAAAVKDYLGRCYRGPDTDWKHVTSELQTLHEYLGHEELQQLGNLPNTAMSEFAEIQVMLQADSKKLAVEIDDMSEAKKRVEQLFDHQTLNLDLDSYESCIQRIERCIAEFEKLGNWIGFLGLLREIREADLTSFIDACIDNQILTKNIPGVYRRVFYKQWIESVIFSTPELASFTRIKQDQLVKTFIKKDDQQYKFSKLQIKAELSQKRPNLENIAGGGAVSILRREGQKKRKQMPIRKLFSEIGKLVQIIKPCFLMSPLSVSTFLEPEKITFDTIVFDEASQVFPQDAIGAIYRGKQLIVVGDSKQMPPSNFFNASTDIDSEDEELGGITDFESILDICSSVFDTKRLAWHYRSHYEQLIAFSNSNFYKNSLMTFPSSSKDHSGIGVDYYFVDGVFDRESKTNKIEAQHIVDLIYKHIGTYPNRSLGIVAFSVAQQNLIDRLLSKKRESDPSYEWFFKEDNNEPFFIKNLETVQGDERDTIIFSVAYAKDSQGRFILNFGPLNREGGERRLNVAITRARDNVQLVTSIHYTDINLNNTKSEGVRLLRAYLDYAQNGEVALERAIIISDEDHFDSYFEQEVCDFLRDNGFTVDTQVGCSGFRIDLGLRKPDSSNYLLAIECDGATYHRSKNARDRDVLRQRILEKMGWNFYRIWSTDWFRNKSVEKERLLQAAKDAISNNKSPKPSDQKQHISMMVDEIVESVTSRIVTEEKKSSYEFPKYTSVNAYKIIIENNHNFQKGIRQILEHEPPLSEENFLKRIIAIYGREKVTNVVVNDFNNRMRHCEVSGINRKDGFLYLRGQKECHLHVPGERRDVKYIAIEELADGLYTIIRQNVTVRKEGLYKTMTNLLGFSRTGDAIVSRYDAALRLLRENNLIDEDNGQFSIK